MNKHIRKESYILTKNVTSYRKKTLICQACHAMCLFLPYRIPYIQKKKFAILGLPEKEFSFGINRVNSVQILVRGSMLVIIFFVLIEDTVFGYTIIRL